MSRKKLPEGRNGTTAKSGYDIPITIVGVIGALLMSAGLFALVLQVYGL